MAFLNELLTVQFGGFVRDTDHLLESVFDVLAGVSSPFGPRVLQFVPVATPGHDVCQVRLETKTAPEGLFQSANRGAVVDGQHVVDEPVVLQQQRRK